MSEYVLDASALLALLNNERGTEYVEQILPNAVISAVNVAEVISRLSILGMPQNEIQEIFSLLKLEVIPYDLNQAYQTGFFYPNTRTWGLSLGDRACLALAHTLGAIAVTADQAWREVDIPVKIKLIR